MNGQLVLAGGIIAQRYSRSSTTNTQDRVAIWNETSQTWEYPYPPVPTACSSAWLIHYLHYLVVVGGVDHEGKNTTNVEILDTSSHGGTVPSHSLSPVIYNNLLEF